MGNKIAFSDRPNYPQRHNKREQKLYETIKEDLNVYDDFRCANFVWSAFDNDGGDAGTGAAGEERAFSTNRNVFEEHKAAVNSAALVFPSPSSDGLELTPVAAGDALEVTNGRTAASPAAYTVGTDKGFFFEAKVKIDDISDVTELAMGWRKAEAYQAAVDDYDEMATFNVGADADGQIEIHTILNGAATSETDTTENDWADGDEKTLKITVDSSGNCRFFLDGQEPAVTASFQFDDSEVVVPFVFLDTESGDPGVSISEWRVGSLSDD